MILICATGAGLHFRIGGAAVQELRKPQGV